MSSYSSVTCATIKNEANCTSNGICQWDAGSSTCSNNVCNNPQNKTKEACESGTLSTCKWTNGQCEVNSNATTGNVNLVRDNATGKVYNVNSGSMPALKSCRIYNAYILQQYQLMTQPPPVDTITVSGISMPVIEGKNFNALVGFFNPEVDTFVPDVPASLYFAALLLGIVVEPITDSNNMIKIESNGLPGLNLTIASKGLTSEEQVNNSASFKIHLEALQAATKNPIIPANRQLNYQMNAAGEPENPMQFYSLLAVLYMFQVMADSHFTNSPNTQQAFCYNVYDNRQFIVDKTSQTLPLSFTVDPQSQSGLMVKYCAKSTGQCTPPHDRMMEWEACKYLWDKLPQNILMNPAEAGQITLAGSLKACPSSPSEVPVTPKGLSLKNKINIGCGIGLFLILVACFIVYKKNQKHNRAMRMRSNRGKSQVQ